MLGRWTHCRNMTATIQKWGNSLALRIPLPVAKQIHVQEGDSVSLKVGAAGLTVKPLPKRPSLDDLLAQVTPENLHPATEWGQDVGREVIPA
jgi:antitoxin MazE